MLKHAILLSLVAFFFAMGCTTVATTAPPYKAIAAAVENEGGHVIYTAEAHPFSSGRARLHEIEKERGGEIAAVILNHGPVDDQTIARLAPLLSQLEGLDLLVGQITDTGLTDLRLLTKADRITITSPNVTANAVDQLRKSLRRTEIEYFEPTSTGVNSDGK